MFSWKINLGGVEVAYHAAIINRSNIALLEHGCRIFQGYRYVGFDTETSLTNVRPHAIPPNIIQIGGGGYIYIIDVNDIGASNLRTVAPEFTALMEGSVIKVGFAVSHDITKMSYCGITVNSVIDVQTIAELLGDINRGMDYIAKKLFNVGKSSAGHNWDQLTAKKAEYAARDIILSIACYEELMEQYRQYIVPILLQNMQPHHDLYDLTVIAVNSSPHPRNNNTQVRSLIHDTKLIISTVMLSQEPVTTTANTYKNPFQFIPLSIDESLYGPELLDVVQKYKRYMAIERLRPFTPEENTDINILKGQLMSKPKTPAVQHHDIDPNIVALLPKRQYSELKSLQDLIFNIKEKREIISAWQGRTPIGSDKMRVEQAHISYNAAMKKLEDRARKYGVPLEAFHKLLA